MPLNFEQFKQLRAKGLSAQQIASFEAGKRPEIREKIKEEPKSLLESVGDFLGVGGLAKGITSSILSNTDKEYKRIISKMNTGQSPTQGEIAYVKSIAGDILKATPQGVAGSAGKVALTLGTLGTAPAANATKLLGLTGKAAKVAGVVAPAVEGGILGGAYTALNNLENNRKIMENIGKGVAIGASIPIAGMAIKKGVQTAGNVIKSGGQRIQQSVIRPSQVDVSDGFKIENVNKYGLGGNLETTLKKTESKLQELTSQLNTKLGSRPEAVVDLNDVAKKTAQNILKNKSKSFGDLGSVKNILEKLGSEIEEVSANGLVDLPEAQAIKQAAGKKGAWVFGFRDPEAKATEIVYNNFYKTLREEIEKKAPAGIKEINKQIQEIIPIQHAVIRRIPVAERNNVISLTDLVSLGFSTVDPRALAVLAMNRLSKSGWVGKALSQTGQNISQISPKGNISQRIFGK